MLSPKTSRIESSHTLLIVPKDSSIIPKRAGSTDFPCPERRNSVAIAHSLAVANPMSFSSIALPPSSKVAATSTGNLGGNCSRGTSATS